MNPELIPIARLFNQGIAMPRFQHPAEVLIHMGAIQGQDFSGAKLSIGVRLNHATDQTIENAFSGRSIVRTWLMRGTLHFVAARDIRWINDLVAARLIAANARRYRELELDEPTLMRSNEFMYKSLQTSGKLSRKQLMAALEQSGISTRGQRAAYMLQRATLDNLICQCGVTRNVADFILQESLTDAKPKDKSEALAELAKRYFFSRGPATLADFSWWSGLTVKEAKEGLQAIKKDLEEFTADGQTYYFKNNPKIKKPENSLAFLLPGFDEFLLGYKDRIASLSPSQSNLWCPGGNGMFHPFIILNGKFRGTWKRNNGKKTASIDLSPVEQFTAQEKNLIDAAIEKVNRYFS